VGHRTGEQRATNSIYCSKQYFQIVKMVRQFLSTNSAVGSDRSNIAFDRVFGEHLIAAAQNQFKE